MATTRFLRPAEPGLGNSTDLLEIGNYAHGISGTACAPVVLTLLIVVVCVYKAYKTTLQRLVLYHIIISLLFELVSAPRIEVNFLRTVNHSVGWKCIVIMYVYTYVTFSWYVYTTVVTNCFFIFTLRLMRKSPRTWQYWGKVAECICVFLTVITPMAYVWIPIQDGSYKGLYCNHLVSDEVKWYKDTTVLTIILLVMCFEVLSVYVALFCLFCFLHRRLQNRQLTTVLKYFLYHAGTNAAIIGNQIFIAVYIINHKSHSGSFTRAFHIVCGAGEPVLILLSAILQSFLSIHNKNGTTICKFCCRQRKQKYVETESQDETNPTSHPIKQPSHTYFSIPYTGQFTQVSVNEDKQ